MTPTKSLSWTTSMTMQSMKKVEEAFDEYLDSCEFDELVTLDGEANE